MSTYSAWDVNKATEIANAKGKTLGYVTSVYSTPGMTNLCAGVAEAVNQDGGSIYQDEYGNFKIIYDRDTKGGSVWTSDALGMTFDYSGDTFQMTPTASSSSSGSQGSSFGSSSGWSSSDYMSSSCDNILNRIDASQSANVSFGSTSGLSSNETLDPITGKKIDKEKSEEIDEIVNSKSSQRKFDKIAKLINKVHEAQGKATTVAKSHAGGGALAGAAAGAAIGCLGGPVGALIGGAIGGIVGFFGGKAADAITGDEAAANKLNTEAADEAQAAGQELKEAIAGLSDEELIAFERYYYEQTGVEVSDVLASLEVTADSSTIAQQTGVDDEWLTETFGRMDEANEILNPTETKETTSTSNETSFSNNYKADMVKREIDILRNAWDKAIQGQEVSLNIDGKTVTTAQEIEELINEKLAELEGLQ